jgi:hypothetical protein
MRSLLALAAPLAFLAFVSCTKPPEDPMVIHLRRQILRTQRQLARLELKLKDANEDPAMRANLHEEEELAKSRLARLTRNWQIATPGTAVPPWDGKLEEEIKGFSSDQKEAIKSAEEHVTNH